MSFARRAAANLSGIILAGEKSQRFGRDKARMEVGGSVEREFVNINTPEDYERALKIK